MNIKYFIYKKRKKERNREKEMPNEEMIIAAVATV